MSISGTGGSSGSPRATHSSLNSPTTPMATAPSRPIDVPNSPYVPSSRILKCPQVESKLAAAKVQSNIFFCSCEISLMQPVGSMSISPANRDVVLAARKGLFIIDLEDPYSPPRFLAHMTTWEAVDIQWSPHPARSNWVASTSNQKLLVWNLDRPGDPGVAPAVSRINLRPGSHHLPSPSPVTTSRLSAHHGVFAAAPSATIGTVESTGLGQMSYSSTYGMMAASSSPSQFGISAPRSSAIEHILHAHTRAITDINWSPFHPEILASSSIDTWTWVWDLRMCDGSGSGHRKPAQGYSAWNAAVTQVKFNRASEHRMASTCDNKVLIWDDRKGSLPLATIEAHKSKIYSIDWSQDTSLGLNRLLTCSLDRTVKFWDLSSESAQTAIGNRQLITQAESVIETATPVWRARHLPFGNGVMTLPQRGDTSLSMWAKDHPEAPMATFDGHTDIVKEYLFRTKGGHNCDSDDRQFQLITWSKDQTLRLWPVTEEQTKAVGYKPGAPIRVLNTRAYAPDISYRDPPLLTRTQPDESSLKGHGSASNITISSIMPPERATRSLLSGKGSDIRPNVGSPYGSSQSGFQGRDGRISPVAAFSASFGRDKRLHHSSSHGNLGSDLFVAKKQMDDMAHSLGRSDIKGKSALEQMASSLPKNVSGVGHKPSTSYHSGKLAVSNKSGGSFKLPVNLREGRMSTAWTGKRRQYRSHAIQKETEDITDKARIKKKQHRGKQHKHGKVMGASMRLDRARMTSPAVDPVGWIANVRMQKDPSTDTRASEDTFVIDRGTTSGGEMEGEAGLSSQRLGDEIVALNRKLPRIVFEKVKLAQRTCTLSMYGPWADREPAFLRITMIFPISYPRRSPKFDLEKSANITLKTRAYLLRGLTRLATCSSELGRPCAEICARFLLGEPVELLDKDDDKGLAYDSAPSDSGDEAPKSRMKMPARRCGASFGPNGELVVFGPRATPVATPAKKEVESRFLRSYTALSGAMSSLARYSKNRDSDIVQLMSSDFFGTRLVSRRRSGTVSTHHADMVGNARADRSTVKIFWPLTNKKEKPPFLRRRSSSVPTLARPESKGRHASFADAIRDDLYIS